MNQFWQTVYEHRFSIGGGIWYVVTAFIVTLPDKDKPYNFYDHVYDFAHQLLNIKPIAGLTPTK
jgi:hypothetical protein